MAVNAMMPSLKFPIRKFSFGLCWLISGLTTGTTTAGVLSVATKGEIGIEPPIILILIGSSAKALLNDLLSQLPIVELIVVRNAGYEYTDEKEAIFPCLLLSVSVGEAPSIK